MAETIRNLAVLGSPITHSLSPQIHSAAYKTLGLPWQYQAIAVTGEELPSFLSQLDETWLGLSLTMPLKTKVVPLVEVIDPIAASLNVVNTLKRNIGGSWVGLNTDVGGLTAALSNLTFAHFQRAAILGGGATALSTLLSLRALGVREVELYLRNPEKSVEIKRIAAEYEIIVRISELTELSKIADVGLVVSTLPGTVNLSDLPSASFAKEVPLYDIAYDPWPTKLAAYWLAGEGKVASGVEMLVQQALRQIRYFVLNDCNTALPKEEACLAAMQASVA